MQIISKYYESLSINEIPLAYAQITQHISKLPTLEEDEDRYSYNLKLLFKAIAVFITIEQIIDKIYVLERAKFLF